MSNEIKLYLLHLTVSAAISVLYINLIHFESPFLIVAKTSALLINYNLCFSLVSCLKFPKMYVFLPFSSNKLHMFHTLFIYLWSTIHIIAHYLNYSHFQLNWGVGFTGLILASILIAFLVVSIPIVKKKLYHKFFIYHCILFIMFVVFTLFHGSFCFFKNASNQCPVPTTWIWIIVPFSLYLLEFVYKVSLQSVMINRIIRHSPELYEVQLALPKVYAGKHVYILCPHISILEWHPFAVTFYDDKTISCSIHVKISGNWTRKLSFLLDTYNFFYPNLYIHGPFHMLPETIVSEISERPCILFSSGYGITTYAHLLSQLIQDNVRVFDLHLCIVVKTPSDIMWTIPLLSVLYTIHRQNVTIEFFFTQESPLSFPFPFTIGRPNFTKILFSSLVRNSEQIEKVKNKSIHVYHSGVEQVSRILRKKTNYPFFKYLSL